MAGQTTGLQKTYIMEDVAIGPYTAVTRGVVGGSCAIPIADNAIPLGVVTNDERQIVAHSAGGIQVGRNVAVQLSGIADVKLSGNVTYGEKVIVAAGGSVKRMPQNPGISEVTTLKITAPCTTAGDVTLKLNGVDQKVTVALTDSTAALVATAIATAIDALDDYAAVAVNDTVTITAVAKGYQVPPTFDGGATGVTGNIAVATAGKQEGNGSFNVLGIAEASGLDGDIIPVRIDISHYYVA